MNVFSVMRKRDDLPVMTLPLAVLMMVLNVFFSGVAGRLASAEAVGAAASLPFLALSACLYALLMLLWRNPAAFLVTPLAFVLMLFTGSSLFAAVCITLSLLFTSCVFAESLISRESRFRRIGALACAAAICLLLTAVAFAGWHAASPAEFAALCMDVLSEKLGRLYDLPASEWYVRQTARSFLVMTPAYTAALAIALAWFTELLAKSMFRLFGCTDLFIRITHRITLPLPYALLYAAAFLLTMMTHPEEHPFLYAMLDSVVVAMLLPCAAVGASVVLRKIRVRMYYAPQKRATTGFLLLFAFLALGVLNAAMLFSVAGVYFVTSDFVKKRRRQRENENREDFPR
ncbi:MAG: hypothetical protein ACI4V1_06135 [Eubacteriales bacterium]